MELLHAKQTRFSEVVEAAGKPEVYTLWVEPARDKQFQKFLKAGRVMSILGTESGTDFGVVGFHKRPGARFLVFGKSLKQFTDHRIVGIKWELVKA